MREYIVLTPINQDGVHHAIGDSILLADNPAGELLAIHAISLPEVAVERLAETLRGSEYLPTLIRITKDLTIPQAEIIQRAFSASGLDRAAWNGLPDDDRELRIMGSLELVRGQHVGPVLGERSLGSLVGAAEGARVAADNAVEDPEARASQAVVFEHERRSDIALAGGEFVVSAPTVLDVPAIDSGVIEHAGGGAPVETDAPAPGSVIDGTATTVVAIDPVEAVMPEVVQDSANRGRRRT